MGNTAEHILLTHAHGVVHQARRAAHLLAEGLRVVAQHFVIDEIGDLVPECGLGDMAIDVDGVLVAFRLPFGVRQYVAGVGLDRDFWKIAGDTG